MSEGAVFEMASQPPPGGSTTFSLDRWNEWRDKVVPPQFRSDLAEDPAGRIEFLVGAALYGLRFDPDADPMEPGVLKPQQLLLSDLLDAGHDDYVIEVPRRASKTTTILCKMLGRCASRSGYQVAFAAQSGIAGSRRFGEWKRTLDRHNPVTDSTPPWLRGKARPKSKRHLRAIALFGEDLLEQHEENKDAAEPEFYGYGRNPSQLLPDEYAGAVEFRILAGEVGKGIYWANGSQLLVFKPDESAVRGEAADVFWLDEAQDVDLEDAAELMAGLKPLMDTRPGAALVVSGTAGPTRAGPLWERLQQLRAGDPDVGGADWTGGQYEVDAEPIDWELLEDEEQAMALVVRVHPGIGTLTTVAVIRKRYRDPNIPHAQWAREYLSIWPRTAGARAVPATWWEATATDAHHDRPRRVAFAFDVSPKGDMAAIAAAWRDDDGLAYIEVVAHHLGTGWLPPQLQTLAKSYPGTEAAFDDIGEGRATASEALNLRPRPRLRSQSYTDHAAGCVQIMRDLERGTLRHYSGQAPLNAAVQVASRRQVKGQTRSVWMWAVGPEGGDITALVAATRALRHWDLHMAGKQARRRVIVAT